MEEIQLPSIRQSMEMEINFTCMANQRAKDSRSIRNLSDSGSSKDSTELQIGRYLNAFHEQSEKRLAETISKQPWRSAEEAYKDYDRTVKRTGSTKNQQTLLRPKI